MANFISCDRCGRRVPQTEKYRIPQFPGTMTLYVRVHDRPVRLHKDLCQVCTDAIDTWLGETADEAPAKV